MRRLVVAGALFVVLAGVAHAAGAPTAPTYDSRGRIVSTPLAPPQQPQRLTDTKATQIFLANPKVRDWLKRYSKSNRSTTADFDQTYRFWNIIVIDNKAGWIAKGKVDDATGHVTEAWTGPQVAWGMARGSPGAFGGKKINSYPVWLAFCGVFLLGLIDWRRPFSLRSIDLLAMLAFSVSLWFFNRGNIFASAPLAYPPLFWLLGRGVWVGLTGRSPRGSPVWPAWVLLAATVFVAGFRVGLNVQASNVIDVGYSGVIGAERIVAGEAPYGHMPVEDNLKPCGGADANGEIRERIQTNGRCESANPRGDTYGPVAYEAYIPGYLIFGWSGHWDDLPAAHATVIAFDLLCILGMGLVGLRFGGPKFGAALAFAWAANPLTQYADSSNTNDAILPALLIFGFWLVTSPFARGFFAALAGWTKFAALIIAPLWIAYRQTAREIAWSIVGYVAATLTAFSVLLLEPNLGHAIHEFWARTFAYQVSRDSPFSIWDWRQYHAKGLPDLHILQRVVQVLVVLSAFAFAVYPRRKTPLQLAALTGALLVGFELMLTYWIYAYIVWFVPFVAYAALAPRQEPEPAAEPALDERFPEPVAVH
jgi:hypothetical protein